MSGIARPVPVLLLGLAIVGSAATLVSLQSQVTFFGDEWDFLADRRAWTLASFFEPHNEHISIVPVAVYKLLVTSFGMESPRPFQLALTACVLANGVLVFIWVRRRLGDWLALAATLPLFFFGSSAFSLLWAFQITLMGSLAFGIAALIALDREDRPGDRLACALLLASVATNSAGLAFVAGTAIGVMRRPDRRQRAYVFAIPLAAYALWWVGWGVTSEDALTSSKLIGAPGFVFDGFASSISSLVGLVVTLDGQPADPLSWGRPLLVVGLALAAWRLWKLRAVSTTLATVLGTGLTFWGLAAMAGSFREPTNGRYQYLGAVFVILIAAELWRGARPGPRTIAAAIAIAIFALVGNLRAFEEPHDFLAGGADATRAQLGAAELARDVADPAASPVFEATLGPYLEAVDSYGSPAFDSAAIAGAQESVRNAADQTFGKLLMIEATPLAAGSVASLDCRRVRAAGDPTWVTLAPGGAVVVPDGSSALALRRYSSAAFPVGLGEVPGGQPVAVEIPVDRSDVPWTLAFSGAHTLEVCELSA